MNTREIAIEFRLDRWAQVMHERVESGLSIRAYCKSTGIHQNTYFYWQRKLREAACSDIQTSREAPSGWTSLCISEKPIQSQGLTVEVSGCRITVLTDTDPELLTKVCRVLRTI